VNRACCWLALALAAALLAGCSGVRPYPSRSENNARVFAVTQGGVLTSVEASLDVYAVDPACQLGYQGTVTLREAPQTVGLPVGTPSYLVFRFDRSTFLAGNRGSISYETLFTPRKGELYAFAASYRDSTYDVIITDARGREIDARALDTCTPR